MMKMNKSRVAIVGAGMVGSAIAFSLVVQGICAEVILIDRNEEKALGEVLDLRHGIEYLSRNVSIRTGSYADCHDADIVVLTAAAPAKQVDRLAMLGQTAEIAKDVVESVMASGFDGIFLVVSNPVDVISYYVYRLSGLPKNQVIGTGTALETARLKQIIGQIMGIDPRSVEAYSMGEHGDSQMVPWSHVRAGGKSFCEVIMDDLERFQDVDLNDLVHRTAKAGWEVLSRKGSTQYGIASATAGIISAILQDENRMIPVSTLLEGEYGESDIYCGVPAILNRGGVADIGEFHLTDEESLKFHRSVAVIRESLAKLPTVQ